MNEEKIIDYLKEIIQEIEYRHKDGELILVNDTTTDKLYYSIKGLLDLYNKEIQRNKDLEEIEKEHKEENGRLRDRIKELEKQYKILEVEKLRYNIQYLESDISQTPDTAMVYYSMKNCLETLREEKIKLETELQELLEESD